MNSFSFSFISIFIQLTASDLTTGEQIGVDDAGFARIPLNICFCSCAVGVDDATVGIISLAAAVFVANGDFGDAVGFLFCNAATMLGFAVTADLICCGGMVTLKFAVGIVERGAVKFCGGTGSELVMTTFTGGPIYKIG